MGKIEVISKVGNTVHPKYGRLEEGMTLLIDKEDFGKEIFEKKRSTPEGEGDNNDPKEKPSSSKKKRKE